jgi:hypothetical protein
MEEELVMMKGTAVATARMILIALLLGVPAALGAQAPRPAGAQPEVFTGTASVKNAKGSMSGTLEVRLRRVTPDFDRTSVETGLKQGGYAGFLTAIRNAPDVGQVVLGGGQAYSIRYARERRDGGVRKLILVTDKPMFFMGGGRADVGAASRKGFEVAVLEIEVDAKGAGKGSMAAAARVRPDGDGGVLLDDYAEELITLSNITRKPL